MAYSESLFSKICDENSAGVFARYDIRREHFATTTEQSAYDFIAQYATENGGKAPSYAALAAECPDITYIPGVSDSFEYLSRKIKQAAGKRRFAEFYEQEIPKLYENSDIESLISVLQESLESIKLDSRTGVRNPGKTLETLAAEFRTEYDRRKAGKSFKLWKTPFPTLNAEIGGLYSGDIYGIMAESGRGKTYLSEVFADEMLRQGATILVKSYEVAAYPWLSRLVSIITAREEAFEHSDFSAKVGLPNRAILSGKLDAEIEQFFYQIVAALNDYYPGKLILQAKGDAELTRSLDDLERELAQNPKIDAVVIDPFYGISDVYGRNSNRTTGGAADQAARRFENIIGASGVVGMFTIQADSRRKNNGEGAEDRARELRLPTRDQVKTTAAVLEIATNLFTFDAFDGLGKLGIEKGRNGGEGFEIDLLALMDYGVLREMETGEAAAAQFSTTF